MGYKNILIVLISLPFSFLSQWGCTDPQATNYDANASMNDGSCIYSPTNYTLSLVYNLNDVLQENSDFIQKVCVSGTKEAVRKAFTEITNKFSHRITTTISERDARAMIVDGGVVLNMLRKETGAIISLEDKGGAKQLIISGSEEAVEKAKAVVTWS